jgi:hypothetical protein
MPLIVEDGTGLSAADALVSVDDCTTYCTDHGLTDWTGATRSPPEDDEAAIRRATAWLSNAFTWKGTRTNGRDQALAFPRTNCTDGEGEDIASDEVPVEIVQACCIAAAYERGNPGGLNPAVTLTDRVKSERVGPIATEYASTTMSADAARPILTRVMDIIGGLLSGGSNSLVGTAVRG